MADRGQEGGMGSNSSQKGSFCPKWCSILLMSTEVNYLLKVEKTTPVLSGEIKFFLDLIWRKLVTSGFNCRPLNELIKRNILRVNIITQFQHFSVLQRPIAKIQFKEVIHDSTRVTETLIWLDAYHLLATTLNSTSTVDCLVGAI